jgi:hypothetical protein
MATVNARYSQTPLPEHVGQRVLQHHQRTRYNNVFAAGQPATNMLVNVFVWLSSPASMLYTNYKYRPWRPMVSQAILSRD